MQFPFFFSFWCSLPPTWCIFSSLSFLRSEFPSSSSPLLMPVQWGLLPLGDSRRVTVNDRVHVGMSEVCSQIIEEAACFEKRFLLRHFKRQEQGIILMLCPKDLPVHLTRYLMPSFAWNLKTWIFTTIFWSPALLSRNLWHVSCCDSKFCLLFSGWLWVLLLIIPLFYSSLILPF